MVLTTGTAALFAQSSSQGSMQNNSTGDNYNAGSAANTSSTSNEQMSNTDQTSADQSSSSQKLDWRDRHFVEKAAKGGQSEVALGQLAQDKASNPDVKAFAQSLVQDHSNANSQLMQLAQQKNVQVKQEDATKDHMYKRLSKASGQQFDREFVQNQIRDHEKDIKMFEKEAKDAKDPDVRNFASQVLPKLREHLAMAQRLKQSIVPTGRSGANSWRSDAGETSSTGSTSATSSSSMNGMDMSGQATSSTSNAAGTSSTSTSSTQ